MRASWSLRPLILLLAVGELQGIPARTEGLPELDLEEKQRHARAAMRLSNPVVLNRTEASLPALKVAASHHEQSQENSQSVLCYLSAVPPTYRPHHNYSRRASTMDHSVFVLVRTLH